MTEKDKLQKQAFDAARKADFNGIILLPTGTGKGKIMIDIVKHLKPKNILYLCDTTLLRDKMIVDEFRQWGADAYLDVMDRVCYQTAYKWKNKHYDLILCDEFDASLTPKRRAIYNNITADNRIMVSATLDDDKRTMAKKIAPIIFEVTPAELGERKVLNKVDYYYVNYDLTPAENIRYLNYNKEFSGLLNQVQSSTVKAKLEWLQIQRKQFLSSLGSSVKVTKWILKNLEPRKQKILIFCGLSEQADKICQHSYHSNSEDQGVLQQFDAGHILTLAVVNKVDRGLNIAGVRHIIHESTGRSKTRVTQRTGRGMRLDVEETLNVFFLIPHFIHPWHGKKETVVKQWIVDSTKDMNLTNVKTINYNG
jgi:superfamily II DNA or RNA helicase